MASISIDLPAELVEEIGKEKAEALAREALIVRLYDLGEISTGRAAEILGVSRRTFLDILGRYGVSDFDESADIAEEAKRA